ncbi:hypothetical protein ILYODFUR_023325 [Ilyodon furcidens]|uniref:Uncharacterized protein n=1 Tax=Ilyodon furcidens TaxID=33524 RepID=A0ABV0UBW9_9TELE
MTEKWGEDPFNSDLFLCVSVCEMNRTAELNVCEHQTQQRVTHTFWATDGLPDVAFKEEGSCDDNRRLSRLCKRWKNLLMDPDETGSYFFLVFTMELPHALVFIPAVCRW